MSPKPPIGQPSLHKEVSHRANSFQPHLTENKQSHTQRSVTDFRSSTPPNAAGFPSPARPLPLCYDGPIQKQNTFFREQRVPARILNGNAIRAEIYGYRAGEIAPLAKSRTKPGLAAVRVGDDPASRLYVNSKIAACEKLGLASFHITPPAATTTEELLAIVNE